jgi:ribosomal protein L29
MNNKQLKKEMKNMSQQELVEKLGDLRQEKLALDLNAARTHVKSFPSMKRMYKRAIARGLTLLRQTIGS